MKIEYFIKSKNSSQTFYCTHSIINLSNNNIFKVEYTENENASQNDLLARITFTTKKIDDKLKYYDFDRSYLDVYKDCITYIKINDKDKYICSNISDVRNIYKTITSYDINSFIKEFELDEKLHKNKARKNMLENDFEEN